MREKGFVAGPKLIIGIVFLLIVVLAVVGIIVQPGAGGARDSLNEMLEDSTSSITSGISDIFGGSNGDGDGDGNGNGEGGCTEEDECMDDSDCTRLCDEDTCTCEPMR